MLGAFRLIARYQALFCCLVLVWALGIIIGTLFLTTWGAVSKLDQGYPDIHQLLQKRTFLNADNPKVARALKYCSPLMNAEVGQEGQVDPESHLEAVMLMMRHGDRGPMQDFRNLSSINCGFNSTAEDSEYQRYESDMKPHQGRTLHDPFRHFAPIPGRNVCLPGLLTKWGALQQIRTGHLLGRLYVDKLKLLDKNWGMDDVVVFSTMVERTYQSAVGFLYAFLPDFDLIKVTVKVSHRTSFCYTSQYCTCPLADRLSRAVDREKWEYVNSHPAVQSLVEHVDSILRFHQLNTGSQTPPRPDDVLDKLLVFVCHRTSLPCYPADKCVTVEQLHNIISFVEWRGKQLIQSENVKILSRLSMHGFLMDLVQRLLDVKNGRKKHKVVLYSAHDKTLMPLMTAMGVYEGIRPPFSSRLVWELYSKGEKNNGDKVFYLKIIYNGKDVTKKTNFCSHKKGIQLCLLDTFVKFVKEDYLKAFNITSFRGACTVQTTEIPEG